jgi:hypothetical protein
MSESARISKGDQSEQDAATPLSFIQAVERRFGPIQFDLAAHKGNTKHARYFAPKTITATFDPSKIAQGIFVRQLMRAGAHLDESEAGLAALGGKKGKVSVPNHDAEAAGLDAFAHDWANLSRLYRAPSPGPTGDPERRGLLWLNPEYSEIAPWAERCAREGRKGANIIMLVPASVGANWFRDHVAGTADVSLLLGRLTFVGSTAPYPKDCLVARFHDTAGGTIDLWDWKAGAVRQRWAACATPSAAGKDAA